MNPPGHLSYGALDLRRVLPCKRCGQHPKVASAPWICQECKAGKPMRESHPRQYCREDHAGKRERLRVLVEAAIRAGEIRYEPR